MADPIEDAPIPEPRIRRRPAPVAVAYRMAYVGTVSLHGADGGVLETKRFGATPHDGPSAMLERIADEVIHQRARYRVPIAVIQDGAPEVWTLIEEPCERRGIPIEHQLIDRFHVDERLASACEAALRDPRAARALDETWQHHLDHSDTAIDRIVGHLDRLVWHATLGGADGDPMPSYWHRREAREPTGDALRTLAAHVEHLRRYRRRMRYASRLRAGLPIGSGATEGACKSLVTVRLERSGQRWFESGVVPCLSLRARHLSERLHSAFARVAAARAATIRVA